MHRIVYVILFVLIVCNFFQYNSVKHELELLKLKTSKILLIYNKFSDLNGLNDTEYDFNDMLLTIHKVQESIEFSYFIIKKRFIKNVF